MNAGSLLALAGAALCSAAASVLLKAAAMSNLLSASTRNLAMLAGAIALYGLGFLCYGVALRSIPVGPAYASMVGICVLALFLYSAATGGTIGARDWVGAAVIVVGVILLAGHGRAT